MKKEGDWSRVFLQISRDHIDPIISKNNQNFVRLPKMSEIGKYSVKDCKNSGIKAIFDR